MAAHPSAIQNLAQTIRSIYPGLNTGIFLGMASRVLLESLAETCGVPASLHGKVTSNDLIGIYLVALKDGAAAIRTAAKVVARLDPLGYPEQIEPTVLEPIMPAPEQAASVDLGAVRAMVKEEVKATLHPVAKALQAAIEDMDYRTSESLSDMGDRVRKLASAHDALRSELLADVAEIALGAASEALKQLTPTRLEISLNPSAPAVPLGLVHKDTAKIINALAAGVNVYLHGPAGAGKTTVARKCAEAFAIQFYFAAKVESEYLLLGFKDAKGETVRTQFREAYEHGGVFLFDEMDASAASAVVAMNAALANGVCPFPDGIVSRHPKFYAIGAGNTKLTGASRQYAGRNQLDAASIDRFAFIEFGYDEQLEAALATDQAWCKYVIAVRKAVADRGLNHLVSPRATYDGCKLLTAGFDRETVKQMVVYKGLEADTMAQIEKAVRA